MNKIIKKSFSLAFALSTAVFTIVPEKTFDIKIIETTLKDEQLILLNRLLLILCAFGISILYNLLRNWIWAKFFGKIAINGINYNIEISYGNLLKKKKSQKVISFDECFTTKVGDAPEDIKPTSLCGQYLQKYPIQDMQKLIEEAKLKPTTEKSRFNEQNKYESGTLLPRDDYLLMAFAKLDEKGLGTLKREEYLESLSTLWSEINKYFNGKDVCISILGSGLTRMEDKSLTQQELVDIIVSSYILSPHKLKNPYKLCIVCKRNSDFSLNKVLHRD